MIWIISESHQIEGRIEFILKFIRCTVELQLWNGIKYMQEKISCEKSPSSPLWSCLGGVVYAPPKQWGRGRAIINFRPYTNCSNNVFLNVHEFKKISPFTLLKFKITLFFHSKHFWDFWDGDGVEEEGGLHIIKWENSK